ncbi:MAG: hypothetical protein M1835_005116 [Candelina submexicana]|nr:MAG: hypothetical protein M1835_005116 [Candelina submexicana]
MTGDWIPLLKPGLFVDCVDVHLTLSEGLPRVFRFSSLETFYLESCIGSEELLESLAVSFGSTSNDQVPKIKDFRFRHEDSTTSLRVAVGKFLSSFSGLRSLSILLDRTEAMPHPRCFTEKHGKTLKTLVWDGRSEPRSHFCLSTAVVASDPFVHSELVFISENCPHLVELGVSIDWRHHYHGIATSTRQLKSLRTFNIRNPPETSLPTIGSSASILPVGKFPRIAATEMMESMMESEFFMTARRLKPCSVKLIAIGSITFRHIRPVPRVDVDGIEDEDEDEELREFLTPRFFLIKYHRDAFGERKPLLTEVGMGTSYGVEAFEPNLEIFKPYWLS